MNRTVITSLLALMMSSAYAQLEKGTFRLGGTMGFSSSTTSYSYSSTFLGSDYKVTSFSFNPNVSYFLVKQLSIGLALPCSIGKTSSGGADTNVNSFSAGPMIRYYFPFNKMAVFPEFQYTLGQQTNKGPVYSPSTGTISDATIKSTLSMLRAGLGVTYFLNSNIGIEGMLYYSRNDNNYDGNNFSPLSKTSTSQLGVNVGFQIYFK